MTVLPPEVPGPNPGEPGHYAHHDWLTASVKALDLRPSTVVCTSTTRPPAPMVGTEIYETNTKNYRMWDGSAWLFHGSSDGTLPYTPLPGLAAGWSGTVSYARVSGWVHVYVGVTKASWTANEGIGVIPSGYRPTPGGGVFAALMGANGNAPLIANIAANGDLRVNLASSTAGGLYGAFAYPLFSSTLLLPALPAPEQP